MANVAKLLVIQGGKCFYCGNKLALEDATIDHVIPKAMGGDNSEANTVACCHSINHAFGNATPKEKLIALINGGGRIDCPVKPKSKTPASFVRQEVTPPPPKKPVATAAPKAKVTEKTSPEQIRKQVHAAFQSASAAHTGQKALLSTLGNNIRERVDDFKPKNYGHSTLGKLVTALGYRADNLWCYPQQK